MGYLGCLVWGGGTPPDLPRPPGPAPSCGLGIPAITYAKWGKEGLGLGTYLTIRIHEEGQLRIRGG